MRNYVKETTPTNGEVIWYEEDGVRYSFGTDPSSNEYQEYLKSLDEANTL